MPVTAIEKCTTAVCRPLLVNWLGVGDANFPDGSVVAPGSPYSLAQLTSLLYQSDYETALLIVDNLEHPYRAQFVTEETDFLADGALLPPHLGAHSKVTIRNSGVDSLGQIRDFHRIKMIKKAPMVYGSPNNLYAIHASRIHLSNATATVKLDIPSVIKGVSAMLTPVAYQWCVIAGAILKAGRVGLPENHRAYWAQMFGMYLGAIRGADLSLPEPEQLERIGT